MPVQEELYRKAFASFGVNDTQFGNWSNGVAWLGWSRGQSMHGVGVSARAPLSRSWMSKQWGLQRQILVRMRALGIVPVLPAFQGNVPPVLKTELFPRANISVQGSGPRPGPQLRYHRLTNHKLIEACFVTSSHKACFDPRQSMARWRSRYAHRILRHGAR